AAHYPNAEDQEWRMDPMRHLRRICEDSGAHDATHHNHRCVEKSKLTAWLCPFQFCHSERSIAKSRNLLKASCKPCSHAPVGRLNGELPDLRDGAQRRGYSGSRIHQMAFNMSVRSTLYANRNVKVLR